MKTLLPCSLAAALLVAVGLVEWTQAQPPGDFGPPNAVPNYTVVSSDSATVLLETSTGRTWLLAGVEWRPIKGGPEQDAVSRRFDGAPAGEEWPKLSPFSEVICQSDLTVLVRLGDAEQMQQLISINDIPTQKILTSARATYRDNWEKRFTEDLVQVLAEMGRPAGETVKLVLLDRDSGETQTIAAAPMTRENRSRVYAARHGD